MRLVGDDNDNVCLDTVATTIAETEEIRLVCFVVATEAAGKDDTGDDVDTVTTKDVPGETGILRCSEMTENSTEVSNHINLIPIGLDTVANSTTADETVIGGYAGAAESFLERTTHESTSMLRKIRRNFLQLLVTISIHLDRTLSPFQQPLAKRALGVTTTSLSVFRQLTKALPFRHRRMSSKVMYNFGDGPRFAYISTSTRHPK